MFENCSALTSAVIPGTVESVGYGAFYGCGSLTNITIQDGVVSIGDLAFDSCSNVASVTLPKSISSLGLGLFHDCGSLMDVMVDDLNPNYRSVDGVLFNKAETAIVVYPPGRTGTYAIANTVTNIGTNAFLCCRGLTSMTLPDSVTTIENFAFYECTGLTNVVVPSLVTSIGISAFYSNTNLTGICFKGSVPSIGTSAFANDVNCTVYYLPGTAGWGSTFERLPTAPWLLPNPVILNTGPAFGFQTNGFGFVVSWATNLSVVVEATTTLTGPNWSAVATNSLNSGSFYFSDPTWMNYPSRFYRIRSPAALN